MLQIKTTLTFGEYSDALRFGSAMRLRRQTIAFVAVVAFEVLYYILGKSLGIVPYWGALNALAIAYMLIFLYGISKRERAAVDYAHRKDTLIGRTIEYTFTDTDMTVAVLPEEKSAGETPAEEPAPERGKKPFGSTKSAKPDGEEKPREQVSTYALDSLHCAFEMRESFMLCPTVSQMFILGKTALPEETSAELRDFLTAHMPGRFVSDPDGSMSRSELFAAQKRFFG